MQKSKGGRPPKYENKEEIEGLIEDYFKVCDGELFLNEEGNPIISEKGFTVYKLPPKPPTVTGLALALGFNSRQALLNYQAKKEFNDTITRAKSYIEEYAERRLFDRDGVQGAKFSLINNFKGWSDKSKDDSSQEAYDKLDKILEGISNAAKS